MLFALTICLLNEPVNGDILKCVDEKGDAIYSNSGCPHGYKISSEIPEEGRQKTLERRQTGKEGHRKANKGRQTKEKVRQRTFDGECPERIQCEGYCAMAITVCRSRAYNKVLQDGDGNVLAKGRGACDLFYKKCKEKCSSDCSRWWRHKHLSNFMSL